MARKTQYRLEAVIVLRDRLTNVASRVQKALGGLKRASSLVSKGFSALMNVAKTVAVGIGALGAAVGGAVVGFQKLADRVNTVIQVQRDFSKVTKSMGMDYQKALEAIQKATGGTISKTEGMRIALRLMRMGLVKDEKQLYQVVKMATRLGDATLSVSQRVEDFALLLANQSIPRLDNYGISSGKVRERIEELMKANKNLARDQAFVQAVLEIGGKQLEILGDQAMTTGVRLAQLRARFENLKDELLVKLEPVLVRILDRVIEGARAFWVWAQQTGLIEKIRIAFVNFGNTVRWVIGEIVGFVERNRWMFQEIGENLKNIMKVLAPIGRAISKAFAPAVVLAFKAAVVAVLAVTEALEKALQAIDWTVRRIADNFKRAYDWWSRLLNKAKKPLNLGGVFERFKFWKRQAGGIANPRGWTLVGEKGPELVRLPPGSRVVDSERSQRMLGEQKIVINVTGDLGTKEAVRKIFFEEVVPMLKTINFGTNISLDLLKYD